MCFFCAWEVEGANNMTVYWSQIERSGFESLLGSLCCVFGQGTLLSIHLGLGCSNPGVVQNFDSDIIA